MYVAVFGKPPRACPPIALGWTMTAPRPLADALTAVATDPARRTRRFRLAGRRRTTTLPAPVWASLEAIAAREGLALPALVARVAAGTAHLRLARALELFATAYLRAATPPAG